MTGMMYFNIFKKYLYSLFTKNCIYTNSQKIVYIPKLFI